MQSCLSCLEHEPQSIQLDAVRLCKVFEKKLNICEHLELRLTFTCTTRTAMTSFVGLCDVCSYVLLIPANSVP